MFQFFHGALRVGFALKDRQEQRLRWSPDQRAARGGKALSNIPGVNLLLLAYSS